MSCYINFLCIFLNVRGDKKCSQKCDKCIFVLSIFSAIWKQFVFILISKKCMTWINFIFFCAWGLKGAFWNLRTIFLRKVVLMFRLVYYRSINFDQKVRILFFLHGNNNYILLTHSNCYADTFCAYLSLFIS